MKTESGITLVELLAALAIMGIIVVTIASVLTNGTNSADRTATKQRMQQEANYIVEVIRAEYLKSSDEEINITSDNDEKKLMMDSTVISQGYEYQVIEGHNINRSANVHFEMLLISGEEEFEVKTTFSKLR